MSSATRPPPSLRSARDDSATVGNLRCLGVGLTLGKGGHGSLDPLRVGTTVRAYHSRQVLDNPRRQLASRSG
jgi:hypothetical protein